MAKKKAEGNGHNEGGETVAGYFRKLHEENPRLFSERSNDKLLQRWLADHPEQTEVPKNVKASLSNIKSVLRSKHRKQIAGRKQRMEPESEQPVATVPSGNTKLETLEHQIDECLILAKSLDRTTLESVISHLRRARNEVVWKIGQ